jgi:hypothetical protein
MTDRLREAVSAGLLDFKNGKWVDGPRRNEEG